MKFSIPGIGGSTVPNVASTKFQTCMALMLFTACANSAYGLSLSATASTTTLTCNTATGPGAAASITIKASPALTGVNTLTVSLVAPSGGLSTVTTPTSQVLNLANNTAGIVYVVNYVAGCAGATAGSAAPVLQFRIGGSTNDVTVTLATTVTASTSALTPSPAPVTVTCVRNGPGSYTAGASKTVAVTSAATGGTPFTVDTSSGNAPPVWLSVTPTTGGTAGSTAVNFTVQAVSPCASAAAGSTTTGTIRLLNAPGPVKNLTVNLQVVSPTTLVATPATARITFVKGTGTPGFADVAFSSSTVPAPFFTVDTSSLPIWLTVDSSTGTVPKSIRFSSTTVADSLAPGTYSANVLVKVSGVGDLTLPVSFLVTNPASKLTIAETATRPLSWTVGNPAPTAVITAVSSDSPIPYTTTVGGTLAPVVSSNKSGFAYSYGTQLGVTFNQTVLAAAQPGDVLTGTVTLAWGSPVTSTVVTFTITVQSPGATLTAISPGSLPTSLAGQSFTAVITGSGFIQSSDPSQKTKVGIVVNGSIITDTNISWVVQNPSNIVLTIAVPAVTDQYLPFAPTGSGGTVNLGVCNPSNGTCSIPTGTVSFTIGNGPIIQVATSSASFIQVNPGTNPTMSPYDMISVFGTNFCSSSATGCSSSTVLYGVTDGALKYPPSLTPDTTGNIRNLTVKFQTTGSTPTVLATAPLLFATNNQINFLVPAALASNIGTVHMVVSFGYGSGATMLSSAPFPVTIAATNPGVYTVGADGQGQAAALATRDFSLIGFGNEAGVRSVNGDSDTVMLFVTGLGVPDSLGASASGASAFPADCTSIADYLAALNAQTGGTLTTVDGVIVQSTLLGTGRLSTCFDSVNVPTVKIGNVSGTVTYAGWVAGAVAGLYQINVRLPNSTGVYTDSSGASLSAITATPVQLPVVVRSNSINSQVGVNLWVARKLKVVAPTALTGPVGALWPTSNHIVLATEGSGTYIYAVTSGLLPSGLILSASTGAISGTPAANTAGTYQVTVTVSDNAGVPIKDSVTFTLTITGGLYMNLSVAGPFTSTFGTGSTLTTVAASGGVFPYTYSITAPGSLPTGMAIDASTGDFSVSNATPAGAYTVTVRAIDSTGTPLAGNATFTVTIGLLVANSAINNTVVAGAAGTINTVTATGQTSGVTYTLDSTTTALGWVTITNGVVAVTTSSVAGTHPVTVTATSTGSPTGGGSSHGVGTVTYNFTIQP